MGDFTLVMSEEERAYLHQLVRSRIEAKLHKRRDETLPPPQGVLHEKLGAFVTLKKNGQLRGCIGNLTGTGPLYQTVGAMAEAAAFGDRRFPPVDLAESANLATEISVMGPVLPCPALDAVEIGRHGLIVRRGPNQGLLLPQVPVEWGWNRETFIAQTCRKAGFSPDVWKDEKTVWYWFEAFVI